MSAFEDDPELWAAYEPGVRALAARLIGDAERSEDVVQETWLTAIRSRGSLTDPGAWLRGVVRNLVRKEERGEGRRRMRELAAARPEGLPSAQDIVEREATRRRVLDAVMGLREPYRTTILLRYFENLSPRRIARERGEPVETVRTRLARGIRMLRERLERSEGPGSLRQSLAPLALIGLGKGQGIVASALAGAAGVTVMTSKLKLGVLLVAALVLVPLLWISWAEDDGGEDLGRLTRREQGSVAPVEPEPVGAPLSRPTEALRSQPFEAPEPEEAPAAARAHHGDLIVEAFWADGKPAADVEVSVLPWGGDDPFFNQTYGRTDDAGRAVFREMHAGSVTIMGQLGGFGRGRVEAGAETTARLDIPAGFEIRGVVVDEQERPVPGASIILTRTGSINEGRPITKADAAGRFTIPSAKGDSFRAVGARAPGFAPSPVIIMMAKAGETREVRLVLADGGGRIEGVVSDPEGEPVTGALVRISGPTYRQFTMKDGRQASTPGGVKLRTDIEGRFAVDGLPPGLTKVAIRARGWAPWRGEVQVEGGGTAALEARLVAGVTVRGRILGSDGEPAVRVIVQAGKYGDVTSSFTRTAPDGSYRLRDVEPGEIRLSAERDEQGEAKGTLRGNPGDVLEWNARLKAGGIITGRVQTAAGRPLAGWSVSDGQGLWERTDEAGRFEMRDCKGSAYTLRVYEPMPEGSDERFVRFAAAEKAGIRPDAEPVTITVEDEALATGAFQARILDSEGQPLAGATFTLSRLVEGRAYGGRIENLEAGTGRVHVAPLPPGSYRLSVTATGFPRFRSEPVEVRAGQTGDLGDVTLEAGGTLRVDLAGFVPEGRGGIWLTCLRSSDGLRGRLRREGRVVTSAPLAPGDHLLQVGGLKVATEEIPFTIASGRETKLEVTIRRGRGVIIGVTGPAALSLTDAMITVSDASGRKIIERKAGRYGRGDFGLRLGLGRGRYTVTVRLNELETSRSFDLETDSDDPFRLTLQL